MASPNQLKVDPAGAVFNAPFNAARSTHMLTNGGGCRLTWKIKCTHPDLILSNPVFAVIDAGQSAKLNLHGRFKEAPDPKQTYRVYVQFAEAPADVAPGDDQQKLRQGWANIKNPKTYKLTVTFNPPPGGEAPAAPPAESPKPPAPEAPPAEAADAAPPAEEPPPAE